MSKCLSTPILDLGRSHALALAIALSACKTAPDSAPDAQASAPAPSQAPGPVLAPDVLMVFSHSGGFSGDSTRVTVFADGRVERKNSGGPRPPVLVRVPVARVKKLTADLVATGAFAVKDGAWRADGPESDEVLTRVVARDEAGAVHSYTTASGGKAPDNVTRALRVGSAFAREVEAQRPPAPCACQPGDPHCVCP